MTNLMKIGDSLTKYFNRPAVWDGFKSIDPFELPLESFFASERTTHNKRDPLVSSFDMPGVKREEIVVTLEKDCVAVKAKNSQRDYKFIVGYPHARDPTQDPSVTFVDGVLTLTFKNKDQTLKENEKTGKRLEITGP